MLCCNIWDIFDEKNNFIKEYKHWKLLIRNRNQTLGNCVAITKRHLEAFSEITPEEMQEFAQVVKDVENSLKKSFSYDKINYQMLMMVDNHTHFHIIPRYSSPRKFAGREWTDDGWPKLPGPQKEPVPQDILQQVKEELLKNLH
jgi:diadenosine tetraphosphate (Ap4A) HIT family hydrolase